MGSGSSRPADAVADSVSPKHDRLAGQVALITGCTPGGIGYETARVLAKHGAHVVLAARSTARAEDSKDKLTQEIKAELPDAQPQFSVLPLDLSSLESVRSGAEQFLATGLPLHLLINNAGILTLNGTYESTKDGFESHVGTNHLGHYYLTKLLLPKLRSTATAETPAKIINVSSGLHTPSLHTVEEIEKSFTHAQENYSETQCYNRSKLYNIYHAQTLAKTEAQNHIVAFSLHPGVIATNISHTSTGWKKVLVSLIAPLLSTPNAGAATTVHIAFHEGPQNSGKYFVSKAVASPKSIATNEAFRAKLIEVSEKLVENFEANRTHQIHQS